MESNLELYRTENDGYNIIFIHCNFFMCKMQEGDNLLDHIHKGKALTDQLVYMEVSLRDEDFVMTMRSMYTCLCQFLILRIVLMMMIIQKLPKRTCISCEPYL